MKVTDELSDYVLKQLKLVQLFKFLYYIEVNVFLNLYIL